VISRAIYPTAVFDMLTRQDGLELPSMEEQREESILRVEDAMLPAPAPILDSEQPHEWAAEMNQPKLPDVLLVRLHPTGWSSVTRKEVEALIQETEPDSINLENLLADRMIPCLHPDQPLDMALRYVDRWPIVPVVSRADQGKIEGVVTQEGVLERYRSFA
jgi:CIC family chloride channel protein